MNYMYFVCVEIFVERAFGCIIVYIISTIYIIICGVEKRDRIKCVMSCMC